MAGGVLGYYIFVWLFRQGFYGMMIPGALLGLGCGLLSQHSSRSERRCAPLADLGLGVYTEWKFFPFIAR